jgi:hypothetical protein
MATTKIWPVKDSLKRLVDYASNPEKTTKDDLAAVIEYAMNGEKTAGSNERSCYVTGVNCFAETALEEMLNVQRLYGKTDGNVAYHCYQSFKPGEVTAEQCHRLGVELAERMWGDKYQVLVATHLDRDHLHNHLVCCSVSFIDGKKFNDNKAAYSRLRRLSDDICLENGLSVIEKPLGKTPRQIHFAEKNGEPTRYNLMREAIDNAIALSTNMPTFMNLMKQQGYVIAYNPNRKYPTIRSVNSRKATRLFRLGDDYDVERIMQRINSNSLDDVMRNREDHIASMHPPVRKKVHVTGSRKNARKVGGLYGLYLHYLYLLGYRPRKKHRPLSPEMREACRMCDKYSECAKLMAKYHLRTEDDVKYFIARSEESLDTLSCQRNKVRNKLRRAADPEMIESYRNERDHLTSEITMIRKEIKTAAFTLERSEKVKDDIRIELEYCHGDNVKTRSRGSREITEAR